MGTFKKVSPGTPVKSSPAMSAAWLNSVSEYAAYFHSQIAGGVAGPNDAAIEQPTDLVKVLNLTGADRLRGHVVQVGAYLLAEIDPRYLWFEGNTVAAPANLRIAILRQAVKAGEIAPAQMAGVSTAIVNVTSTAHTHAEAEAGEHVLRSAPSGAIEILSPLEETGEQEVAVLLGEPCCDEVENGLFDWYGMIWTSSPPVTDLFYRTPSVVPDGETPSTYTSSAATPDPWEIDYSPGSSAADGKIVRTLAPFSGGETAYAVRSEVLDHPDAEWGTQQLEAFADLSNSTHWDLGTDAEYSREDKRLTVTTAAATADAYIEQDQTLTDTEDYRVSILAKADEVTWLLVTVEDYSTATDLQFWINLTAHTIHGATGEVNDAGDGSYEYVVYFTAATPSGGLVQVRLVDDDTETTYDGADGDGAYVYAISLKPHTSPSGFRFDVSNLDCEDTLVIFRRWVRDYPIGIDGDGGVTTEETLVNACSMSRVGSMMESGLNGEWDSGLAYHWWANGNLSVASLSTSGGSVRFLVTGPANTFDTGVDASWKLTAADEGTSSFSEKLSGEPYWTVESEYPTQCPEDLAGSGDCFYKDASFANDGADFNRIVVAPPHTLSVFSITPPRLIEFTDSTTCPGDATSDYFGVDEWYKQHSTTFTAAVLFGGIEQVTHPARESCDPKVSPDKNFITADGTTIWSDTSEQDRVYHYSFGGFSPPEYPDNYTSVGSMENPPHVWCAGVLWADANDDGDTAALFVHGRSTVSVSGSSEWYLGIDDPGDLPTESATHEVFLKLRFGYQGSHTDVLNQTIWRDSQLTGEEIYVTGLAALQQTESAQWSAVGSQRLFVYFLALWVGDVEPTSGAAGTRRGWRMVVCGADGGEIWHEDCEGGAPDVVGSSDRYFYVVGFPLCDARVDSDSASNWAFSHDGEIAWPFRQLLSPPSRDNDMTPSAIQESNGRTHLDCVKNSDRIPLCPAYDQWLDRMDVRTELLPDLAMLTLGADGDYTGGRLETTNAAATSAAEFIEGVGTTNDQLSYRITIEAAAGEVDTLMVELVDFKGSGDHCTAWLNLSAGTVGTINDLSTIAVTDLGGGMHRFELDADVDAGEVNGFNFRLRLVDSNGATSYDGDVGDGAEIQLASLGTICIT